MIIAADDTTVNLAGGWDDFWSGISGATGFDGVQALMTAVGALIVVMAIGKWLWEKRRGGGGGGGGKGSEGVLWALALGAILSAPGGLIPLILKVLDFVANGVIGVFQNTSGT